MKINALTLAISVAASQLIAPAVFAVEAPKVYGKAFISLQSSDLETDDSEGFELKSNASRIGIKGDFAINEDIQAIYKAEFEVNFDDGDKDDQTITQRNIVAGFRGDFGEIVAGKHDTPVKMAQGKVDRFNDLMLGDVKNVFQGENRTDNIIMYTAPEFVEGLTARVAFVPGEEGTKDNGAENNLADGVSSSLNYKAGDISVTLAHDNGTAIDDAVDSLTRLVGEYKGDGFKLGALYQMADLADGDDEDGMLLSGEIAVANNTSLKLQLAQGEVDDADTETTQLAFGVDHKLSKAAKVFAYYATIEEETAGDSDDDSTFGVGFELKF